MVHGIGGQLDGRTFAAVVTTGIYCRPVCPGRPKPQNVRWFRDAAAARAAGFRPCLRCRPEAAPGRRGAPIACEGDATALRLPYRRPFDAGRLLAFLADRATPGVEVVADGAYRRTVMVDGVPGTVSVAPAPDGPALVARLDLPRPVPLLDVVARLRRLFDLDADPQAVAERLGGHATLAERVRRAPGLRLPGAWDPFELAVRAVLGQQVSVRGATTLAGRLAARFGEPLDTGGSGLTHLFPTPVALAEADVAAIGLPRARAATIRALAVAVASGALVLDPAAELEDTARLCAVPGIGPWTAHYVAMRALGARDAFPAGDLGLRRALARRGRMPAARALEARAEAWRPWRAYAVLYLWTVDLEVSR